MAKQSHIEQLIRELCPNGAPISTLEKACDYIYAGGTPLTSHPEYYDGDIPWLRSGEIDFNVITSTEKSITQLGLEKSSARKVPAKSVLMAMTGATVAKVATTEIDLTANQSVCALVPSSKLNYRYLYYFLSLQYDALRTTAQGALTSFNLSIIKGIRIPFPPLPIQEEIVRILDTFAGLIGNIDSEIGARQRQFEVALNNYFEADCNKVKIASIGTITRGRRFVRTDIMEQGTPCIHYGDIYTRYPICVHEALTFLQGEITKKMRYAKNGDVVYVGAGENDEDIGMAIAWLGKEPAAVHDACYILSNHNQDAKYLAYMSHAKNFHQQLKMSVASGKICSIPPDGLGRVIIPLPSLKEQQAIAEKLDTIEALIANLKEERDLRQQQYEYYRAKLISLLK